MRQVLARGLDDASEVIGPVDARHAPERLVAARLEADVQEGGDATPCPRHRPAEFVGDVGGLDRGEADALDVRLGEQEVEKGGQSQLAAVCARGAIASEVDAREHDLVGSAAEGRPDGGENLVGGH